MLEIKNLSKSFGEDKIINGISLQVEKGTIYGFLGQNGAGKTTTMKMVLGLLKPNNGSIKVNGEIVTFGETKTNKYIGYLPDVPEYYPYMRSREYLALCGELTGMCKEETRSRSEELLELVGLKDVKKAIGGYSRGMKQRLGVAQALLNKPKLLICDEPTSALDPAGRKELLDILYSIKGETTIIFSTHILSDVERICDNVAVLHKGKLVLNGPLEELKKSGKQIETIKIDFATEEDKDNICKNELFNPLDVSEEKKSVCVKVKSIELKDVQKKIFDLLAKNEIYPSKIEVLEPTLEGIFMDVIE